MNLDDKRYHEQEVKLRLKFESKLNSMHALHRELDTQLRHANSIYENTFLINKRLESKFGKMDESINNLKVTNI